ncbi:MAG: hypothetical protein AAF437_00580 [Pseudomonadota bacterium]
MVSSLFGRSGPFGDGKWALWASGLLAIGVLSQSFSDLFAGVLPGLDDMMRLQQVRDLLAGQSWFNVDQSRLLTPEAGEMHWSRLPDMFLAGFIWLTAPLIGQGAAEALAVGIWPLALLATTLILLCMIMQRLGVGTMGQVCGLFFFFGSAAFYNFWPGRIDHHGLVVVLILGGFSAIVSKQMSPRSGFILGLCVTAALSIAVEALPYVVGLIAIAGLFWVVRGHLEGVRLAVLGLSLMAFSTVFYGLDAPGFGPRRMVCDAYGHSHWAALGCGGLFLTLLGVFCGWLDSWPKRLITGAGAAALTLAVFIAVNPACFGDPYAAVPDSVRVSWLNAVAEAQTLPQLLESEMDRALWVYGFLTMASLATVWMIAQAKPEQRLSRIGCLLLLVLATLATMWQLRGQSFSHVFAVIGAGWFAGVLFDNWRARGGVMAVLGFAIMAVALSPFAWRAAGDALFAVEPEPGQAESLSTNCVQPENYETVAAMPAMRVHSPIDLGIPILLRTPHEIFVGPYHRNVLGIERANLVLIGDPEQAQQRLVEMGATHLAYCRGLGETNRYGKIWPDGLAARLNRDDFPDWLEPVDGLTETEGVVRIYRVKAR